MIAEENSGKGLKLWIKLMKLGALTGCHQKSARSFFYKGYQFPLCARCTGLTLGQLLGIILLPLCSKPEFKTIIVFALCSTGLLAIDGLGQLFGFWVSTNFRRFFTGLTCGFFVFWFIIRLFFNK